MMATNPFETFWQRGSSEAELHEAAGLLGPVVEPPSFWSAITNDASMPVPHRKMALVQLVRRHVAPGTTTVGAFAKMLDSAPWLGNGDITAVTHIGGKVPVAWSPDDTVIAIALPGGRGAIYLAITGRFTLTEIETALHGISADERILSAIIRDAGIQVDPESEKTPVSS